MPAAQTQLKPRPTTLAPEACSNGTRPRARTARETETESFDQHLQKAALPGQKPAISGERAQDSRPMPVQGQAPQPKAEPEAPGTPAALILPAPATGDAATNTTAPAAVATDNPGPPAPDTATPPSGEAMPNLPPETTEPVAIPPVMVQVAQPPLPKSPHAPEAGPASVPFDLPVTLPPAAPDYHRTPATTSKAIGMNGQTQKSAPAAKGAPTTDEMPPGGEARLTEFLLGDERPATTHSQPARPLAFATPMAATDPAPTVTGLAPAPQMPRLEASTPPLHTAAQPLIRPLPPEAVPMTIAAVAREGTHRFEIRLDPAELGRIEVSIAVDREGAVRTHLVVERPETLNLLRHDAPKLEQALADAGLKPDTAGLSLSLKQGSGQGSGQETGQQQPQHRNTHTTGQQPTETPTAQDGARFYRTWSAATRLDLVL